MEKKIYYIPTVEIVSVETERMMQMDNPSNMPHPAPPRRDPVF